MGTEHKKLLKDMHIGVIAGGISAERDVSLRSGTAVFNTLREKRYNVTFVDAKEDVYEVVKRKNIEIAFLTLHGGWGEDGSIQGMFEVMGIPYTGSRVLASALAMDKEFSKRLFQYHGLKVPSYVVINSEVRDNKSEAKNYQSSIFNIQSTFPPPWIVKPAHEGSSVGVSIVDTEKELLSAFEKAKEFGRKAIVEHYIHAKEVQIGILGKKVLGGVEVRPKRRFYDYQAKYTPGLTEYILPPELDGKLYDEAKENAYKAHRALGCKGATRVDLLIDKSGGVYLLEVNTLPGMTETSLLPKIAQLAGYDFPSFIEEILFDAINGGD